MANEKLFMLQDVYIVNAQLEKPWKRFAPRDRPNLRGNGGMPAAEPRSSEELLFLSLGRQ